MIPKRYIRLAALLVVWVASAARAADFASPLVEAASAMKVWRTPEGLPSDSVSAVIQTRDGFLWIGTSGGLVRFDGVSFTRLDLPLPGSSNATSVTALCEDAKGHLWIGTQQQGVFELTEGNLRHFNKAQGLLDDTVTALAADSHDQVWIGGNHGLNLWDGEHFKAFTQADGLADESVSGVNVARSGTVWITTRSGMCRYLEGKIVPYALQTESQGRSPEYLGAYEDRRGNLWAFGDTYLINLAEHKRFNYFRSSEPASVRIWSLCEGTDGRLWIGTSGRGLFCFEDNRFEPVILGDNRWPYDVRSICEDREGNLWLGTSGGGLLQLKLQSVYLLRGGQGLPESAATALALDGDGHIYVGLQRGGIYLGESERFNQVGGSRGTEVQNFITSLCSTHDGTLWAGTFGNGLFGFRNGRTVQYTDADGLANNTVLAVAADSAGQVWASTSAGSLHRVTEKGMTNFDGSKELAGAPITAMIAARGGGLWLGTAAGQIVREEHDTFTAAKSLADSHAVIALFEDADKRLWAGTAGGGLNCISEGRLYSWAASKGLPNEFIGGVAEDRVHNLMLVTAAGIFRINKSDVTKMLEDVEAPVAAKLISSAKIAGDSGSLFGGMKALLSPDGHLWFATADGVLNVDTRESEIEPANFPIYIESAAFNGDPPTNLLQGALWSSAAMPRAQYRAPVNVKSLDIHFTALHFNPRDTVQFRHRLDGFDLDWVEDGAARLVRYGKLPYGDYRFHVATRTAETPWQEATDSFAFLVPTPVYFQRWAIALYAVFATALIAAIVRIISHRRLRVTLARMEQQQSLERERMRIARDMHDEMGSKLTKISFLSEHAQMDAGAAGPLAGKMQSIAETSQELLKTMDEIVWVVNPRNDVLENLIAYLGHYAIEYFQNTTIECELRLPPEIPHHALSSETRHNLFLTFEETLNNILKHAEATTVKVEMKVERGEFELKVTDNGKGFDVKKSSTPENASRGGRGGNGLKNMKQRLHSLGGSFSVSSQPGEGSVVTIQLRLNSKS